MKYQFKWERRDFKHLKGKATLMCRFAGEGWAMLDIPLAPAKTLPARKEQAEIVVDRAMSVVVTMIKKDLREISVQREAP